ncbi:MAG: xanthine dehydrogenase family protein molybdopterin-binding subunit [Betaproteobacteria bacterium]|nr:xanthine dehydrogenase family protein molybdopterin-binding subunit [Betaproteobacteria bacterium]
MSKFALGQSVTRIEDAALVQGTGRYTDDFELPGAAHAYILRSPHAHANIVRIDTAGARRAPGVLAVLTGADAAADGLGDIPCIIPVTNLDGTPRADTPRPVLAGKRVRHVGDPVALVVAETLAQARDAAELVEIEYEPLPAAVDTRGATQAGAPRAWEHIENNLCFDVGGGKSKAAVDAAFLGAAHVTRIELINNRVIANPIEPRAALADFDSVSGRSTLYTPSQGPHFIHGQLTEAVLKIGKEQLRVISGKVGGAFGMKIFLHPEQPLVVWASRRLKRAVRWTGDRGEGFVSDVQGRDNFSIAELALDADGHFLALRVTTWANMGAYLSNYAPYIPQGAVSVLSGVYRIPAIYANIRGVVTNTVPVDAYRGAGRPEAIYLVERIVDVAARELGLAPDELRRRNFIKPADMPYQTPVESRYDSGDFAAVMARAMEKADWAGFAARRDEARRRGKLRGIGMAMYIERCGGSFGDTVILKVDPEGSVTLISGMQDNGQGHVTTFVQLLSDKLGLDASHIRVVQGDTDVVPSGFTGGSRFLAIGGVAAMSAADEVIAQGKNAAAGLLEAAAADVEYGDGEYRIAGTDRAVSLFEVARATQGLQATHTRTPEAFTYPNGCHICELEVDADTGVVRIARYSIVDDFGRAINPLLLEGQVHGGTVQGIGQALLELGLYDAESGQLLTGSFMDYAMPRADDVPAFDCGFHHIPCASNPLGVKGAGEAGAVGAPPAVINAVVDALYALTGMKHIDMPATHEKLWRALRAF